jgi:hypothetical protein
MKQAYCILCRRTRETKGGRILNGKFICSKHRTENLEESSLEDFKLGLELVDLAMKMEE